MMSYIFLIIGLLYVTVIPGFVFVELVFPKFKFWKKIPLYLVLSVILSTYLTYFTSLMFGFNRFSILIDFCLTFIPFVYLLITHAKILLKGLKSYGIVVAAGFLVLLMYFTALYPGIFTLYEGGIVMSGPNWQDTAMHQSIIENFAQGNFPPEAPYFSGQPLGYYYFADFHAAIVNTIYGQFFPRILVLINPFLAGTFFWTVFALTYLITKRKFASIFSGILAVLYGNMGFLMFWRDLFIKKNTFINLIAEYAYHLDDNFYKMTPLSDYFLQNRPMMVGLPAFVSVVLLLSTLPQSNKYKGRIIFVAGLITGSLIKFQLFGFGICLLFAALYFATQLINKNLKVKQAFENLIIFIIPVSLFVLCFSNIKVEERSIVKIFVETFRWGPWSGHSIWWFLMFTFLNLNLGFVIFLVGSFIKRVWRDKRIQALFVLAVVLAVIPFAMTFTIYEYDMFKFFYYLTPCVSIILGYLFSTAKNKKAALFVSAIVFLATSLTSINMLMHSYFNKGQAYTYDEYLAGLWIRSYTPREAVFVTMPSVHAAPSDIGGRRRVISYTTWPYSHGFNVGNDNVFSRAEDVENVYESGDISSVKLKYGSKYIFYGQEEAGSHPDAPNLFDKNPALKRVFNSNNVLIYEIF